MPATTMLLIFAAFLLSLALAFLYYFFRTKKNTSRNAIFATLRGLSLFSLLVLLINPQITGTRYTTQKSKLLLAVDNSASISHFGGQDLVTSLVQQLQSDKALKERFDIRSFSFGKEVQPNENFSFDESETNLAAVFNSFGKLYRRQSAPVVLISDGNQTLGEDFIYAARRYKNPVLPVIIGDTATYRDLRISRVNVNRYAFLNNRFPVEIFTNYSGNEDVESRLEIYSGNTLLTSQPVSFSSEKSSTLVQVEIPATSIGLKLYTAKLQPLTSEKNTENNTREFAVEVIDQRTEILLLYSFLHPDLGALKRSIETNEQRAVTVLPISEAKNISEYDLVILYQPIPAFKEVMEVLDSQQRNYFVITGAQTNWNFLNRQQNILQQEITGQKQEFFPVPNKDFSSYQTEDINFEKFPPLEGSFGELKPTGNLDVLLWQQVQGVEMRAPLLAVAQEKASKIAFLTGANIWRWRSHVYHAEGSFESFDSYLGNLIQLLAVGNTKSRLLVHHEAVFTGGEEVVLRADYFDQNFVFDSRALLEIVVTNTNNNEQQVIPFTLKNNWFEVRLGDLPAASYEYTVRVIGSDIRKSGNFKILDFNAEKQFVSANLPNMQDVAAEKGQQVYFPAEFMKLRTHLLNDETYVPVQQSHKNTVSLIDWKFLLGFIALLLSLEWFLRKYFGLI